MDGDLTILLRIQRTFAYRRTHLLRQHQAATIFLGSSLAAEDYAAQTPAVWDALRVLRGGRDLTTEDQQQLIASAVPGKDYPINAQVPDYGIDCSSFKQPGFYAEVREPSYCQIFHRCDLEGIATSFLCPNMTLFNQITLTCDWFFNVDCTKASEFVDYSNSRLGYENVPLLDDQQEYTKYDQSAGF